MTGAKKEREDNRVVKFVLPSERICQGFGAISVRAAQLDYVLRLCFKDFCDVSLKDALDATEDETAAELRRRLKRLSRQRLGEGPELVRFQALLGRAAAASKKRNHVLHGVVVAPTSKDEMKNAEISDWRNDLASLLKLASELNDLASDILSARVTGGWLKTALTKRPNATNAGNDD